MIMPFSLLGMTLDKFCKDFFTEKMTFEWALECTHSFTSHFTDEYYMLKALATTYLSREKSATYKQMKKELDDYQNNLSELMTYTDKQNVVDTCQTMKKVVDAWDTGNYQNVFKYVRPDQERLKMLLVQLGVKEIATPKDKHQ